MARRPTLAESIPIRQAAAPTPQNRVSQLAVSPLHGLERRGASYAKTREQLRHYTGWNYVAIKLLCDKLAEQFPLCGVRKGAAGAGAKAGMSTPQKQHLLRHYRQYLGTNADDVSLLPDGHRLVTLLRQVNPTDWWGSFCFDTHLYWQLTGRAYWWVIPDGLGLPAELYVIPSDWVEPKWGRDGRQVGWLVSPGGNSLQERLLPMDEVIEFKFTSPLDPLDSHSPTYAGGRWIDNSESIDDSQWHAFKNGVRPEMVVTLDKDKFANIDPGSEMMDRIKDKFMQRAAGVRRSGEPLIAPPGITLTPWGHKPSEMAFGETGEITRDQVLALRGVPKALAGISHDLNRASIEGAEVLFCSYAVNPLLARFAGAITERLAKRFDPRIMLWFDDCKPADAVQEREEIKQDWSMGAISPDERRQARGMPPWNIPGVSDVAYLPTAILPLDRIADMPLPGADSGTDGEDDGDGDDKPEKKPAKKPAKDE